MEKHREATYDYLEKFVAGTERLLGSMGVEGVNNAVQFDEAIGDLRGLNEDYKRFRADALGVRAKQFSDLAHENQRLRQLITDFLARGSAKPTNVMMDRARNELGRPFMRGLAYGETYDLPTGGGGVWFNIEPDDAQDLQAYSVDRATWELAHEAGMGALAEQWRGLWIIANDSSDIDQLEAGEKKD